jgi:hypothetical protein
MDLGVELEHVIGEVLAELELPVQVCPEAVLGFFELVQLRLDREKLSAIYQLSLLRLYHKSKLT